MQIPDIDVSIFEKLTCDEDDVSTKGKSVDYLITNISTTEYWFGRNFLKIQK